MFSHDVLGFVHAVIFCLLISSPILIIKRTKDRSYYNEDKMLGIFKAKIKVVFTENIHVVDGDTVVYNEVSYRLHGIDAPESNQRGGEEATHFLQSLIRSGAVTIKIHSVDPYNRRIATLMTREYDINREMVRRGYAFAYSRYSKIYNAAERMAAAEKQGVIWGEGANIMEPE